MSGFSVLSYLVIVQYAHGSLNQPRPTRKILKHVFNTPLMNPIARSHANAMCQEG